MILKPFNVAHLGRDSTCLVSTQLVALDVSDVIQLIIADVTVARIPHCHRQLQDSLAASMVYVYS